MRAKAFGGKSDPPAFDRKNFRGWKECFTAWQRRNSSATERKTTKVFDDSQPAGYGDPIFSQVLRLAAHENIPSNATKVTDVEAELKKVWDVIDNYYLAGARAEQGLVLLLSGG